MRPHPAPSAARTANSCWRPLARTRSRFATLAQAINNTMPTVPINTQRVLPISPTKTFLRKRSRGAMRASTKAVRLQPGFIGNFSAAMGSMRVRLREGHARFKPGNSLAAETDQANIRTPEPNGSEQRDLAVHKLERGREYPDYRVGSPIQQHAPPEDGAIPSKPRFPAPV